MQVNNKPFFLIGARHMPDGGTPALLAQAGFNAYRHLPWGTETSEPEPPPARDEGILYWSYLWNRTAFELSPHFQTELTEYVRRVKADPALLCYENLNEPIMPGQQKATPEQLGVGVDLLRQLDPDHPIWLAHSCHNMVETLATYNRCADILGANPYPVVPTGMRPHHVAARTDGRMLDCPDQTLHGAGKYTRKMLQVGGGRLPVWMFVQGMANERWFNPTELPELADQSIDESKILYPTYEELRFMVFDEIICGATGLAFSMYGTPIRSQMWRDIERVVSELNGLHDALAAPRASGNVDLAYTDLGHTIWDGVGTMARLLGDDIYLFAANTAFDPARVSIGIEGVEATGAAVVEGEDRELPVTGGRIEDDFEPYGVHVYRFKGEW